MKTKTVKARKVREGDFLPGIDNGFVYEDPQVDEYEVTIEFHDANGDEGRLTLPRNSLVTVGRR